MANKKCPIGIQYHKQMKEQDKELAKQEKFFLKYFCSQKPNIMGKDAEDKSR